MPKMHQHLELTPLAAFLHKAIDRSGKTQKQLAKEMGFQSQNMISMLKHDAAPFPIERVIEAAIALNVDAGHLLRLVLEQWWPRRLPVIEEIFGIVASGQRAQAHPRRSPAHRPCRPGLFRSRDRGVREAKPCRSVLSGRRRHETGPLIDAAGSHSSQDSAPAPPQRGLRSAAS